MEYNKQVTLAQHNYFKPGSYLYNFKQEYCYAGVANVLTMTLLAPLQRWRIIAQTQKLYPLRPKKFKNFIDYFTRIPKQQGVLSFWRGNGANIWIYLYQAIFQIGIYDTFKQINNQLNQSLNENPAIKIIPNNLIFPFFVSFFTLGIVHPLDTYRIQLNMSYHKNNQQAQFKKFRHRLSQVGGIKNMYQGFMLANIISIINFNFFKTIYDMVGTTQLSGVSPQLVSKQSVISVLAVGLVHPLDTLKKIFQLNNMHKPMLFTKYRQIIKHLVDNKQQLGLFNGFLASVTRTALFTPIYWQILKYWRSTVDGGKVQNIQKH